jgi:hypothetical protein
MHKYTAITAAIISLVVSANVGYADTYYRVINPHDTASKPPVPTPPPNLIGTWNINVGSGTKGTISITGDALNGVYTGFANLRDASGGSTTEMFEISRTGNGFDFLGYNVTNPNWTRDHYRNVSGDGNRMEGTSDDGSPNSTPTSVAFILQCGTGMGYGLSSNCPH